jgi:hypothetical protein
MRASCVTAASKMSSTTEMPATAAMLSQSNSRPKAERESERSDSQNPDGTSARHRTANRGVGHSRTLFECSGAGGDDR